MLIYTFIPLLCLCQIGSPCFLCFMLLLTSASYIVVIIKEKKKRISNKLQSTIILLSLNLEKQFTKEEKVDSG